MKKILTMLTLLILILTTSCSSSSNKNTIVCSNFPATDFTKRIVGTKYEVITFIPTGQDPHSYEPTASKVAQLYDCVLYVEIGLNLEVYSNSLPSEIKDKTLTLSSNIDLLYSHHNHNHSTSNIDDEALTVNPHIWLSIKNAIIMMETIKNKMIEIDSKNTTYYENNYNKNKILFEALDEKYTRELSNISTKYVATTHEAFGYLCRDYDLEEISVLGISNATTPTATELKNIEEKLTTLNIKVIFGEELSSNTFVSTIASNLGIKEDTLNTLEGLNDDTLNDDYLTLMSSNLLKLKEALS